jgi:hypothetical protein
MQPLGPGRGLELKHQLTRAAIAATGAVRDVDPHARFVTIDPIIHVTPTTPEQQEEADAYLRAQYDGWLLLSGELWPQLGGDPSCLDIVGLNYYDDNQWWLGGETIPQGSPQYVPLRTLLRRAYERLGRPLLLAETGAEGDKRAAWLRYVGDEVHAALEAGVPIEGVCLYPVLDYHGWENDRHCPTGLLGMPDGEGRRPVDSALAQELARQQAWLVEFRGTRRLA